MLDDGCRPHLVASFDEGTPDESPVFRDLPTGPTDVPAPSGMRVIISGLALPDLPCDVVEDEVRDVPRLLIFGGRALPLSRLKQMIAILGA